ncbi:hypothetical protein DOTSEDRAFT_75293 [Dothistroma septosporum NZE10]|uniref:YTH domain-containing protein n=1 Tax=Dothistroma septosporum (strain NZE10 / CBS 128990) TaxID=675120 RepID=M2YKU0_DOTSN|nr:hypothetical protein DOTSEDRAFT_75293 [Dothistroma septosporum NZE10]
MSGPDASNATQSPGDQGRTQQQQQPARLSGHAPFQSQLQYLSQGQQQPQQQQYGQPVFDMASLAGALPGQPPLGSQHYGGLDFSQSLASPGLYQTAQGMYPPQRGPQFDPAMIARAQQQQFLAGQYAGSNPMQNMQRPQNFAMPQQVPYSPIDAYGYGLAANQFSPIDPRFATQAQLLMSPGMLTDISQFARRGSADTGPIPNFPRGPPRKPKQSGHALWVGNLPPAAMVTDLKDHFSRDATNDIESVFLIAKSNCAFVNYRTESACVAAMNRFHDSRFRGVRLVCRLRRGTSTSHAATPVEDGPNSRLSPLAARAPEIVDGLDGVAGVDGLDEHSGGPTIARSPSGQSGVSEGSPAASAGSAPPVTTVGEKVPEKYFIVKSLTAQDLEASVRNGIWATQSHNEEALNQAYGQADSVFLIFSANKSGEYFGYARMTSAITGELVDLTKTFPSAEEVAADPAGSPQSIATPATATAPKGRIIDDSARGTIFWEADRSAEDNASQGQEGGGQNWGKQFQIEWLSTNRLPFYRTRGLRNPWNANREVKIARDGTELEPSVGRRLVQMFHRSSPPQAGGIGCVPAPGMGFR